MKNGKRRSWTTADVRTLKTLAWKKTRAGKIAKKLKRTEALPVKRRFVWAYCLTLGSNQLKKGGRVKLLVFIFCRSQLIHSCDDI